MHEFTWQRRLFAALAMAFLLMTNVFINSKTGVQAFEMNNQLTFAVEEANPLLATWTGAYGGIPPFDKVRIDPQAPGAYGATVTYNLPLDDKIAAMAVA